MQLHTLKRKNKINKRPEDSSLQMNLSLLILIPLLTALALFFCKGLKQVRSVAFSGAVLQFITAGIFMSNHEINAQPSVTWEKIYDNPGTIWDGIEGICEADSGNFFLAGYTFFLCYCMCQRLISYLPRLLKPAVQWYIL